MKFSVVYSVDTVWKESISKFYPINAKNWEKTEGNLDRLFEYKGDAWKKGKHRKFRRVLEFDQFFNFLYKLGVEYEGVGAVIEALRFEDKVVPAVVFNLLDPGVIGTITAVPIMDDADIIMMGFPLREDRQFEEENWEELCERIGRVYFSW